MVYHNGMKQTITQLKGGALNVDFVGIVADLAFCNEPDLAEMLSEHLGSKVCDFILDSRLMPTLEDPLGSRVSSFFYFIFRIIFETNGAFFFWKLDVLRGDEGL